MFAAVQTLFQRLVREEPAPTPYQEGATALHTKAANPYQADSKEHQEWERGYSDELDCWSW